MYSFLFEITHKSVAVFREEKIGEEVKIIEDALNGSDKKLKEAAGFFEI